MFYEHQLLACVLPRSLKGVRVCPYAKGPQVAYFLLSFLPTARVDYKERQQALHVIVCVGASG